MVSRAEFAGLQCGSSSARRRHDHQGDRALHESGPLRRVYLSLAFGSIGLSAIMHLAGRKTDAQFIGHWVPTILLLGVSTTRSSNYTAPTENQVSESSGTLPS